MRLTIVPQDGFVQVDGNPKFMPLDLSTCEIPQSIHALQWYNTRGWVEFKEDEDPFTPKQPNEEITELPQWALNCVQVWEAWQPPVPPEPQQPPV